MTNTLPYKPSLVDPRFAGVYHGHNPGLESLIPPAAKCALDVGCGQGGMAAWLSRKGLTVDGISWNAQELEVAKNYCRSVMSSDLNCGVPQLDNDTYDLIICSHILEHIAYPQALLCDLYRVLQVRGHLLVAIPNLFFWVDRLKLLRGEWNYQPRGTFDYTHVRWYTRDSLVKLMTQHGFVMSHFVADGWIPLPGLRFCIGRNCRAHLNRIFCRMFPGMFGQQLLFRFRKTAG